MPRWIIALYALVCVLAGSIGAPNLALRTGLESRTSLLEAMRDADAVATVSTRAELPRASDGPRSRGDGGHVPIAPPSRAASLVGSLVTEAPIELSRAQPWAPRARRHATLMVYLN